METINLCLRETPKKSLREFSNGQNQAISKLGYRQFPTAFQAPSFVFKLTEFPSHTEHMSLAENAEKTKS